MGERAFDGELSRFQDVEMPRCDDLMFSEKKTSSMIENKKGRMNFVKENQRTKRALSRFTPRKKKNEKKGTERV